MNSIYGRWYAKWYDSIETQTNDVEFFIELLKGNPKRVFEICCGTGRVLLPLAREGHEMHGIDMNNFMLERLFGKASGLENIHVLQADALSADWGDGFDAVLMAGNILINIENAFTREDYIKAQKLFMKKSFDALKPGGLFIMDNDISSEPEKFFRPSGEPKTRKIPANDDGISAEITYKWSKYNNETRVCTGENLLVLFDDQGSEITRHTRKYLKYFPTLQEQTEWVKNIGFKLVDRWGDYKKSAVSDESGRVVHFAKKPE